VGRPEFIASAIRSCLLCNSLSSSSFIQVVLSTNVRQHQLLRGLLSNCRPKEENYPELFSWLALTFYAQFEVTPSEDKHNTEFNKTMYNHTTGTRDLESLNTLTNYSLASSTSIFLLSTGMTWWKKFIKRSVRYYTACSSSLTKLAHSSH